MLELFDWILLIVQIPLHELGHYVAFRFYRVKPEIRFSKWGVIFMGEKAQFKLTMKQRLIVAISGIIVGYMFLDLTLFNRSGLLIYLLMCLFDIYIIFEYFQVPKEWRNLNLKKVQLLSAKKIIKENE